MGGIRRGFVTPTGTAYSGAIPTAAELDLEFVELFMEGVNHRERLAEEANEVGTLADIYGVGVLVHLPTGVDVASPHEHVRDGALLELKAALDAAANVEARRAVFHPPVRSGGGDGDDERRRNYLLASVRGLDDYAADRGIDLCVRVPCEDTDGFREGLGRLFESTDAGVCLDTGLATLAGVDATDQAALLLERDERIPHVHCNDVRQDGDVHHRSGGPATGLPLGAGTVDFDRLLDPVREDWSGTLSLSVETDDEGYLAESVRRLDRIV